MNLAPLPDPVLVMAEVRAIAAENPDFVYDSITCQYVTESNQPGCIIGHALLRLGYNTDWYEPTTESGILKINGTAIDALYVECSKGGKVVNWLAEVQGAQDARSSWGTAVRLADKRVQV